MERKRNVKNHDSHVQQQRHRALDAYELYELEHMPRTLQMKVPSIDHAKPREDEVFRPQTGQNSWSQTKDGHQRHRPQDAYELYELEHRPHTLSHGQYEAFRPHYNETGRRVQKSWSQTRDGSGESYKENIDCEAEAFIRLEHDKFELSKWMSMNGY